MVIAIAAISLDGKIALSPKDQMKWGSKEDKGLFSQETKRAGVIVMGRKTFQSLPRGLVGRHLVVLTREPEVMQKQTKEPRVEFVNLSPAGLVKDLYARGHQEIFVAGGRKIYSLFLKHRLIEEFWLTLEPYLFGEKAVGLTADLLKTPLRLRLLSFKPLNPNTLHLRYQVVY